MLLMELLYQPWQKMQMKIDIKKNVPIRRINDGVEEGQGDVLEGQGNVLKSLIYMVV